MDTIHWLLPSLALMDEAHRLQAVYLRPCETAQIHAQQLYHAIGTILTTTLSCRLPSTSCQIGAWEMRPLVRNDQTCDPSQHEHNEVNKY